MTEPDQKDTTAEPVKTLFVSGFPMDIKSREVYNFFRFQTGFVNSSMSHRTKGAVAFAVFEDQATALRAKEVLHGQAFDPFAVPATELRIELAKSNSLVNPPPSTESSSGSSQRKRGLEESSEGAGQDYTDKKSKTTSSFPSFGTTSSRPRGGGGGGNGAPCSTVFVANIGFVPEDTIKGMFQNQAGFRRLKVNESSRGAMAFVDFIDENHAYMCMTALQGTQMPGGDPRGMRIEYAKAPMGVTPGTTTATTTQTTQPVQSISSYPSTQYAPYGYMYQDWGQQPGAQPGHSHQYSTTATPTPTYMQQLPPQSAYPQYTQPYTQPGYPAQ